MQIIIEGYQYPAGAVDRVLWSGAFQTVGGGESVPSGGVIAVE